ncbi:MULTISPECIES: fumarylacetoacetate hydrolase family protein [Herbaspirillum]|uniref:fumarylacetoacetate hydrolase family protein n=1 Tax=Herbaspirillum TaxID=963 RepID=UPI00041C4429|nr:MULTISPECIES: fumarylacetoacetate hydrolase family protein [Herbaspirillum]UIN21146.1 fumarylacetoacetate hydrolase family protein [Herbaspirillum frisingense]UWE16145.1 fumarylacetoacetate hydrolase family protein [Herbaspirillum huttiense]
MKFATVQYAGKEQVALVDGNDGVFWPLSSLDVDFSGNMIQLVQKFADLRGRLSPKGKGVPLSEAKVLAPIPVPARNIFCVGKNYREHAAEFSKSGFDSSAKEGEHVPEAPVIFTKPASTVIATGEKVPSHPKVTQQLDYEAELAVIIGVGGSNISKEDAYRHVWGYTIVNDFTARDLQKLHRQWFLGKSLDGFCPMGPYAVTADEVNPENLNVRCWINGELRQDASTADLIFDIPSLIETISAGIELRPGDIIATGTPAGVGIGFNPPKFLKSGDKMRIEISGLGVLENEVL